MPIYEYRCLQCNNKFDKLVRMGTEDVEIECPVCHGKKARKIVSLFGAKGGDTQATSVTSCAPSGG